MLEGYTIRRVWINASSAAAGTVYKNFPVNPGTVIVTIAYGHQTGLLAGAYARFAIFEGSETAIIGSENAANTLFQEISYLYTGVGASTPKQCFTYGGIYIPIARTSITLIFYTSSDVDDTWLSATLAEPNRFSPRAIAGSNLQLPWKPK